MDFIDLFLPEPAEAPSLHRVADPAAAAGPLVPGPVRRDWDRVIDGLSRSDRPGQSGVFESKTPGRTVRAMLLDFSRVKYGVTLRQTGESFFDRIAFDCVESNDRFGGAFRIGGAKKPTLGPTYLSRVEADGCDAADGDYGRRNTDFLIVERGVAPVYLRYSTASGFSDAMVDAKADVYIANATLSGGHRTLRAHDGARIWIVNSTVTSADRGALAWLGGPEARIFYHNVLWNGRPTPDLSRIGFDGGARQDAGQIVRLDHNPLPDLSPFFGGTVESVAFEVRAGGGWSRLAGGQFGAPEAPIAGDLIFDLESPAPATARAVVTRSGDNGAETLTSLPFELSTGANRIHLLDLPFE